MSFSARCFTRHARSYFTRYSHEAITTSINVVTVNNGQFFMMLISICEMNLDDS
jgi:hypothetical protein